MQNYSAEEQVVLQVKYASKRFGAMSDDEIAVASNAALIKIHAITGWAFPDATVAAILKDQFRKKILESYYNVNPDEMELAFRKYGGQVKDWGKSMNLSLIDEVMIPYLEQRASVSKIEEQKKLPEIEDKGEDITMQDWLDYTKTLVKQGKTKVELMPVMIYDWLDKQGLIKLKAKEKWEYLKKAVAYKHHQLEDNPKELEEYKEMERVGEFTDKYDKMLKELAKKFIVWDLILKGLV